MKHDGLWGRALLGLSLLASCSSPPPVPRPPAPSSSPAPALPPTGSAAAGPITPAPAAVEPASCGTQCVGGDCLPAPRQLTLGNEHACALLADGKVACWGDNHLGQIDDGSGPAYATPRALALPAGFRPVAVATGDGITCALAGDGRVQCRGLDERLPAGGAPVVFGRATTNQPITDAALLSTGPGGMCVAAKASGEVRCYPMVAPGAFPSMATPGEPAPIAGTTGSIQLDGGISRGCVRKGDGSVACWSFGGASPIDGVDDAIDIAVDLVHDPCLLRADGRVQCFSVQTPPRRTELRDVPGLPPLTAIDAGRRLVCGLDREGGVWCWGELGDDRHISLGAGRSLSTPTRIEHLAGASALSVGGGFACAVVEGRTRCFGSREHGRIGDGVTAEAHRPVAVPLDGRATDLAADGARTCAVLADGGVRCWGWLFGPTRRPLGTGQALAAIEGVADATEISLSGRDACAVTRGGGIRCWASAQTAAPMQGVSDAVAFDPGPGYRCMVHASGRVSCFVSIRDAPHPLPSLAGVAQVVSSSSDGFVFRRRSGAVGYATLFPQLIASDPLPAPKVFGVTGLQDAVDVDTSGFRACAVSKRGTVQCQSLTAFGSMGGSGRPPPPPTPLPGIANAVGISVADDSTISTNLCVLLADGRVACQGDPRHGFLGDGKGEPLPTVPGYAFVADLEDAAGIAVGAGHACARHRDGRVSCWGDDAFGQASGTAQGYEPCPRGVHALR
ncbi:MAG: hypothetical protein KC731_06395 [Myxococcales bacterium]|nr:hypothetical protein [Myxococcales bacterium]